MPYIPIEIIEILFTRSVLLSAPVPSSVVIGSLALDTIYSSDYL